MRHYTSSTRSNSRSSSLALGNLVRNNRFGRAGRRRECAGHARKMLTFKEDKLVRSDAKMLKEQDST